FLARVRHFQASVTGKSSLSHAPPLRNGLMRPLAFLKLLWRRTKDRARRSPVRRLAIEELEERYAPAGLSNGLPENLALPQSLSGNLATIYRLTQAADFPNASSLLAQADGETLDALKQLVQFTAEGLPVVNIWTVGATAPVAAELASFNATVYAHSDDYH